VFCLQRSLSCPAESGRGVFIAEAGHSSALPQEYPSGSAGANLHSFITLFLNVHLFL